jgi:cytoskeleton protein RodZ
VLAGVSALLSAAYFARAVTEFDDILDWALCLGLAGITWAYVFSFLDSRMPLLVADSHGVRIRLGRTWRGMAWGDLEEVEYAARRHLVRDGRLVLFPREPEGELAMLGPAGRRHARLTDRLLGAPFAMPLGLTTRVLGAHGDLGGALVELADGRCEIVEIVPGALDEEWPIGPDQLDEGPLLDGDPDDGEELEEPEVIVPPAAATVEAAVVASPTPSPLRDPRPAVRAEVARAWDPEATRSVELPAVPSATTTFVIDDLAALETVDPVIGPELAAARTRLRLTVDQLAERTRIRPHVIEAIEIDDFVPCGGDFYARGHLRTLARVLGVDVAPLLATYDDQYADAPIDPRRVFEAELATGRGGPIRGTRGGPNWSVIVAAVMTVVLAWSVARLVMDHPSTVSPSSPSLADGSAGLTSGGQAAAPVPVVLTAAGGGAHVVVRDGTGKVVFTGSLAFGQNRTLQVSPPVRIQSTDGSVEVTVDGQSHGAIGRTGQPAQDVFTVR